MQTSTLKAYLGRVNAMLELIPQDRVEWLETELRALKEREGTVYVLGNGGSEALAQHLVLHLRDCKIRAFDLMADPAWVTAHSNDYSYETASMSLLDIMAQPGDMVLIISGSGNSRNVVLVARTSNVPVVGILGNGGGKVLQHCVSEITFPGLDYGPLEDCFSVIIHALCEDLK
jgi:D-sedoheptulose 7-phosphate isomerase